MKPSTIIDKIFIRLILFLIIFIIVGFYTADTFSSIASSILGIFILELFSKITSSHPGKKKIKKNDIKKNKDLQNQLIINDGENFDIFLKALKKYNAVKDKDYIKFTKDDKKYIAFLNFSYEHLTKQNILEYYKKSKKLKIDICLIFTSNVLENNLSILNNFKDVEIKIFYDFEVYSFLKKNDALPEIKPVVKEKHNYLKILKQAFKKRNFKSYFMCSVVLFLFSFVTPFKIYYRISTIILLFAALICLIKRKQKVNDEF